MEKAEIQNWYEVESVREISVKYNDKHYLVIYGRHVNGGFYAIPNWSCGGELARPEDVLWNTESIAKGLKQKNAAKAIAESIEENEMLLSMLEKTNENRKEKKERKGKVR